MNGAWAQKVSLAVFGVCLIRFAFADPPAPPHATVELISADAKVQPGHEFNLGLFFKIEKHWHLYWINPGDSGEEPRVKWNAPTATEVGPLIWPVPDRINVGPLVNYGYSDSLLLQAPVRWTSSAGAPGALTFEAKVSWLVCNDVCIPGKADLSLKIPVGEAPAREGPYADLFREMADQWPLPAPASLVTSVRETPENFILTVSGASVEAGAPLFYPFDANQIENAAPQKLTTDEGTFTLELKKSDQLLKAPRSLRGLLRAGADTYSVEAKIEGAPAAASSESSAPGNQTTTVWGAIVLAFLGGLILNLMPCVFPVLSIKALSLVEQAHGDRYESRVHGLLYSGGVLFSFWALAGFTIALRAGGSQLGWGFQLQSPSFVMALAVLLFLMSLNLLGVFEVGTSLMGAGQGLASKRGHFGSFFTGVLAVVVATPCTAPFMGTALGFAAGQPAAVAFVVFTALAIGLALPYLAISWWPLVAKILPKPGRWMETLKQLMAFPLLATALWLLWVLGLQAGIEGIARALGAFLSLAFLIWVRGRWLNRAVRAGALALMCVATGLALSGVRASESAASAVKSGSAWEPWSPARAAELLKSGHPVFVDFTAAWCVTCKVNEMVALTPTVMKRMKELGVGPLRADWTNSDPGITAALAQFGRNGVPLYVLYGIKPGAGPVVLPQILTTQLVLDELEKLKN